MSLSYTRVAFPSSSQSETGTKTDMVSAYSHGDNNFKTHMKWDSEKKLLALRKWH